MLKLEEKDYDMNNLFFLNFDMLKEILYKLSQNQINIQIDLKNVKDSNDERDKKISELENKIKELNDLINNKEKEILNEKNEIPKIVKNEYNNKDNDNIIIIGNNGKNDIIKNFKKEFQENINREELISDESINIETKINLVGNSIEDKNFLPYEEYDTINEIRPKTLRENHDNFEMEEKEEEIDNKPKNLTFYKEEKKPPKILYKINSDTITLNPSILQKKQVTYDIIRKILYSITEINENLNFYEGNLHKKFEESKVFSKKLLSDHNIQSMSLVNSINKKIKELFDKNDEFKDKFNDLEQKIKDIESKKIKPEIIQIFNNNNEEDENNKIISNALKESIDQKFELNDERYMNAAGENFKLKQQYLALKGVTDNLVRQFDLLRKDYDDMKENIDIYKKEINELINNKNNELKNDFLEKMDKNLEDVNNNIDKKTRELLDLVLEQNNEVNNEINKEINDDINNGAKFDINKFKADKALIKLLNKKVTELNEKIEEIEEELKNQKKKNNAKYKEIDDIKQCIVELYENVKNKIEKDDIKELYEYYLEHVNEIKLLKLKVGEVSELEEKIRNDITHIIKRLELLYNEITELKENDKKNKNKTIEKQVDLSSYINEKKLKNVLSPIGEEIEKLISENENLKKILNDISDQIKSFEKKEHVDHIEADLNDKINLLNNRYSKKFLEKIEFNKIIKNIDIQLKLLQGNMNTKKEEADSWILAKQPIKCFNCATCEANIANSIPQNEYLPWNKYPIGEKQYRIGQGFSKLLKKVKNGDDISKIDKKNKFLDNTFENDNNSKLFINNSANNINEINIINNKMNNKDDKNLSIKIKRYKLPKLIENFKRKQTSNDDIPISDEEKKMNEEIVIENDKQNNSPQILKITKVKNENNLLQNENINKMSRNRTGNNSGKILYRKQSFPEY